MKTHYRRDLVICNKPATHWLTSTQEPQGVTCLHCLREMRKGFQLSLVLPERVIELKRPRAIFAQLARR